MGAGPGYRGGGGANVPAEDHVPGQEDRPDALQGGARLPALLRPW